MKIRHLFYLIAFFALSLGLLKCIAEYSSTKYSINYTEEGFSRIREGLSIEQVFTLVGKPLFIKEVGETQSIDGKDVVVYYDNYVYSISKIDSDYEMRELYFDKNGFVARIYKYYYYD